jgi:hypothetical protein
MSDVIDLLEKIGQDAKLRYGARSEVESFLHAARVERTTQLAIVGGGRRELEQAVNATANVCCALAPVEDYAEEEESTHQRPN